jgi:hypothetical protein
MRWRKIDEKMYEIQFPEFRSPKYFRDIGAIMKYLIDSEKKCDLDVLNMTTLVRGQVQNFMECTIRTMVILEIVATKVDKYRQHTREMREVLSAPMDQHRFSYMHMCEELSPSRSSMTRLIYWISHLKTKEQLGENTWMSPHFFLYLLKILLVLFLDSLILINKRIDRALGVDGFCNKLLD